MNVWAIAIDIVALLAALATGTSGFFLLDASRPNAGYRGPPPPWRHWYIVSAIAMIAFGAAVGGLALTRLLGL